MLTYPLTFDGWPVVGYLDGYFCPCFFFPPYLEDLDPSYWRTA